VVANFEPKKITPNCNALAKSVLSYLGVSYFPFVYVVNKQKTKNDVIGVCA